MTHLEKLTQFNQTELAELRTRFARMSKNSNFLTKPQFRDNLGLLGMGTMLYLSDRIFDVMDDDKDGKVILNIFMNVRSGFRILQNILIKFALLIRETKLKLVSN